ncbi:MAG: electron transfer flavoprotein subunit alpha/FixB family protein [SAR202 cluster bacterium]|nr:electron transfer flavoprotein subunit alpha/FixB family protein [SAR202 cluster bacterium]|tara:strand:+ start:2630 stop:3595 length:966 start_codon:yes stop_codon:yes gene_type:complete
MTKALVIGEMLNGELGAATFEGIAAARILDCSNVAVMIAGASIELAAEQAIFAGADQVFTISQGPAADGEFDDLINASYKIAKEIEPEIIIGSKTIIGRDVMPRLAFRLGTILVPDCMSLERDAEQRIIVTRPTYGGNVNARIACVGQPVVISLRPKSIDAMGLDQSRSGAINEIEFTSNIRTRIIEKIEEKSEGISLQDAKTVVAGGRGLGGPEAFDSLQELAGILGGAVGASRAACDAGWVPSSFQVGLTGKTVSPDLYIAIGISGASQHMAGCSNAKTLVAINKDEGANIFKEARFGVKGDWEKVIPAFIEQLHELIN